jgi:hypothetical protein
MLRRCISEKQVPGTQSVARHAGKLQGFAQMAHIQNSHPA